MTPRKRNPHAGILRVLDHFQPGTTALEREALRELHEMCARDPCNECAELQQQAREHELEHREVR